MRTRLLLVRRLLACIFLITVRILRIAPPRSSRLLPPLFFFRTRVPSFKLHELHLDPRSRRQPWLPAPSIVTLRWGPVGAVPCFLTLLPRWRFLPCPLGAGCGSQDVQSKLAPGSGLCGLFLLRVGFSYYIEHAALRSRSYRLQVL